ncbi:hypothetical protein L1D44_01010 [Shewanella sp. Isolate13]|uniref:hypothetical protein n=1 Tax=Shewanella sp. Isolate13 TaxID=2908531 RepID=UPI001EFE7F33|nr:hypothetical protein [Shewanella sp. Isolate13]MCG9728439.1 hypothetical protein [Shewanella sp. Isolate13]
MRETSERQAFMQKFSISRLNTSIGIIKLEGEICQGQIIAISQFSIMGTDGWLELDMAHQHTQTLIQRLQAEVVLHLRGIT